jgi:hypothetical protein
MTDAQDHRFVEWSAYELQTNWEAADEAAGNAKRWEPGQIPRICETPASMKYVLCLPGNLDMTLRNLPRTEREGGGREYVDAAEHGPDLLDQYPPETLGLEEIGCKNKLSRVHEDANLRGVQRTLARVLQVFVMPRRDGCHFRYENGAQGTVHMGNRYLLDLRTGGFEIVQGPPHHRFDALLDTFPEVLTSHTDSDSADAVLKSAQIIADWHISRGRVSRIAAGYHAQRESGIFHASHQGASVIQRPGVREYSGA